MVSSAYSLTVDEIPDEMSFTYKMNKTGPRIVPWGTPDKTGDQDEQVPRRTTSCIRPVKKLRKKKITKPLESTAVDTVTLKLEICQNAK